MFEDILLKNENLNKHHLSRYINFIKKCSMKNIDHREVYEKHHILPSSHYSEYRSLKKYSWNQCKLTLRQHFMAHWMLAKIFGGKQWYAFNQMKRWGGNSILYAYGRKYLSELISKNNKGKVKSIENRTGISKRTKGTVVVRDKSGNRFRVSVEDERYISGELVFYRNGYKNKPETIQKMKNNNGIRGKTTFIENGKVIYLSEEEGLKRGLEKGIPKETKFKLSETFKKTIWVTDKDTGEHKRITSNLFDSEKHEIGRKGFHGFEHINKTRIKKI